MPFQHHVLLEILDIQVWKFYEAVKRKDMAT
jgi:hypothetical protein